MVGDLTVRARSNRRSEPVATRVQMGPPCIDVPWFGLAAGVYLGAEVDGGWVTETLIRSGHLVPDRQSDLRKALLVSMISVGWSLIAGVIAIVVGVTAGALSLLAYGLDAVVDATASVMIMLDLREELVGEEPPAHRRAEKTVGIALIVIGSGVMVQAIIALSDERANPQTALGVAVALASTLVLPPLAIAKLRIARRLRSPALQGDGFLTAGGAALAAVTLIGMFLERRFGWWWADPIAALVIAVVLVGVGILTLSDRGSHART